ncbi:MAG: hypothetical protein KGJ13_10195, partial [Patescibacteria group bacterium]|nr:hypothetical protein [Patescibacteria group bacterium]
LVQKGFLKPGQFAPHYPGDDAISLFEKQFLGQKTLFDQEQKSRETENKAQELDIEQQKLTNTLPGGPLENPEQKYLRLQTAAKIGQPLAPADKAFVASYEKNKTMVPMMNFNLQNAGATGANGQPSTIAKGLADGSIKWNDVVSARTPMAVKQQLLSEVKGIKPDFRSGDATLEQDVRKEFTSGDAAKNLTAFNTAIEHAKQLSDAADALQNGNVVALNKIGNALGYQFGSDKTTNFNVIKNALSGEISKVFKGGQATDAEIREVQAPFSAANSPAQLKGAIQNAIALMNSKRGALQQQYQQGIKAQPNFGGANAGFQLPAGTATAVGPNGHRIAAIGGKWVDAQTGQPIQ